MDQAVQVMVQVRVRVRVKEEVRATSSSRMTRPVVGSMAHG